MVRYWANREELREAVGKYSSSGVNKRLKYGAWCSIGITFLLLIGQLATLFGDSDVHYRLFLWFRGFAGAFAILFAILYTILLYRVHREYWQDRQNQNR